MNPAREFVQVQMPGPRRAKPGKRGFPAVGWSHNLTGPRVVALGDSVTFGVGDVPNSWGFSGWAAHVSQALNASYFLNLSRMGARARTVAVEQLPVALRSRPDIALIIVGGNDVLRGNLNHFEVHGHLAHVIRALQEMQCRVVLLRLHDSRRTLPFPRWISDLLHGRVQRVNNALDAVAITTNLGSAYLDLGTRDDLYTKSMWHIDHMHPSAIGHRWIAQNVIQALATYGFEQVHDVELAPDSSPTRRATAIWLVKNGLPWLLRRSIDLIPAAAFILLKEMIFSKDYEDLTKGLT